ncbi:MAG: mannose-1-phosphate guanylyltransferase [Pirellulales bacterium]
MLHGVIMAGGSGTRFWPASRRARPKQLLTLAGDRSLLQSTFDRCQPWIPPERMWVVTGAALLEETARQLPEVPREQIIAEPVGRNTAPCVGVAAQRLLERDPDAVMLVMPSDHVIQTAGQFRDAVVNAEQLLAADPLRLVLFGVRPSFPATGYGYIERGPAVDEAVRAYRVQAFREKPQLEAATQFVAAGTFYWNCGIFCWKAARILAGLQRHAPEVYAGLTQLAATAARSGWPTAMEQEFQHVKSISIDYAVLEHDAPLCVVEAPFGWDDVGNWLAVTRLQGSDKQGNTIEGPHVGLDTHDCLVRTTPDHTIATVGVSELVIVHTTDATLVARRGDDEGLKKLVEQLGPQGFERLQ